VPQWRQPRHISSGRKIHIDTGKSEAEAEAEAAAAAVNKADSKNISIGGGVTGTTTAVAAAASTAGAGEKGQGTEAGAATFGAAEAVGAAKEAPGGARAVAAAPTAPGLNEATSSTPSPLPQRKPPLQQGCEDILLDLLRSREGGRGFFGIRLLARFSGATAEGGITKRKFSAVAPSGHGLVPCRLVFSTVFVLLPPMSSMSLPVALPLKRGRGLARPAGPASSTGLFSLSPTILHFSQFFSPVFLPNFP
jgi:hypothetical protein